MTVYGISLYNHLNSFSGRDKRFDVWVVSFDSWSINCQTTQVRRQIVWSVLEIELDCVSNVKYSAASFAVHFPLLLFKVKNTALEQNNNQFNRKGLYYPTTMDGQPYSTTHASKPQNKTNPTLKLHQSPTFFSEPTSAALTVPPLWTVPQPVHKMIVFRFFLSHSSGFTRTEISHPCNTVAVTDHRPVLSSQSSS